MTQQKEARADYKPGDRIRDTSGLCGIVIRRNSKMFYGEYEIAFCGFTDWRYASQMSRAALAKSGGAK